MEGAKNESHDMACCISTRINDILSSVPDHMIQNDDVPQWTRVSMQLFRGLCAEMILLVNHFKKVDQLDARVKCSERLLKKINEDVDVIHNVMNDCSFMSKGRCQRFVRKVSSRTPHEKVKDKAEGLTVKQLSSNHEESTRPLGIPRYDEVLCLSHFKVSETRIL